MFWIILAAQAAAAGAAVEATNTTGFSDGVLNERALAETTAKGPGDQTATSTLTASSNGNSVNGTVTTGSVGFSDLSFQNASGLTMVNSNSGNNVAINSAMTVNVTITPNP